MQYKFVNEQHEKTYNEAKALLVKEDERQHEEAARLSSEWALLPERDRRELEMWLKRHFLECRQPYIKLVTDCLALATPIFIVGTNGQSAEEDK